MLERTLTDWDEVARLVTWGLLGAALVWGLFYIWMTSLADALERRGYSRWLLFFPVLALYLILTTDPRLPLRERPWRRRPGGDDPLGDDVKIGTSPTKEPGDRRATP